LLYGPPGTGKTSLSQAIPSGYALELFVNELTGTSDTRLQSEFKRLPSQHVVLMEDIDAVGIMRENFMQTPKSQKPHRDYHDNNGNDCGNDQSYYEESMRRRHRPEGLK
jgi:hypothetical protein